MIFLRMVSLTTLNTNSEQKEGQFGGREGMLIPMFSVSMAQVK